MTENQRAVAASVRAGLLESTAVLLVVMVTIPRVFSLEPGPFFQIGAAAATALLVLAWRGHGGRFVPWPALALVVLAGASVVWSVEPGLTIGLTVITALVTGLAIAFARAVPPLWRPRLLAASLVVAVGGSALWALGDGRWAYSWDWRGTAQLQGLYRNWNIAGYTFALLFPGLLALRPRRWHGALLQSLAVVGVLAALVATRSATSLVVGLVLTGLALGLHGVSIAQRRLRPGREKILWRWVVGLALAGALGAAGAFVAVTSSLDKSVSTLSGRTDLWRGVAEVSARVPIGGFGWGTVWRYHWFRQPPNARSREINEHVPWPLGHGHSTFFDVLPQLGIAGVTLVVILLLLAAWRTLHAVVRNADSVSTWALLTVVAILVLGVSEPIVSVPLGWFLLCLVLGTVGPARGRPLPGRHAAAARQHDRRASMTASDLLPARPIPQPFRSDDDEALL